MASGGGDSDKRGAWEAASIVFRIATVGFSLTSAIMTFTSTQCAQSNGCPAGAGSAGTVSYSDFNSFEYSALADLLSAVLQGVAIYLEVVGKEKAAKFVELIDKLVMALTSSSASLLLAVDDITSCGPPRGPARGRRQPSLCNQPGELCPKVRRSSGFSLAATVSVSAAVYIRHVHVRVARPCRRPPPVTVVIPSPPSQCSTPPSTPSPRRCESPATKQCGCESPPRPPPCPCLTIPAGGCENPPPPYCGCPRLTIPCGCENPPPPYCGCPRLTIPCSCETSSYSGGFFF